MDQRHLQRFGAISRDLAEQCAYGSTRPSRAVPRARCAHVQATVANTKMALCITLCVIARRCDRVLIMSRHTRVRVAPPSDVDSCSSSLVRIVRGRRPLLRLYNRCSRPYYRDTCTPPPRASDAPRF